MANEIYDSTWWGVALDTASSIGTKPDLFGSQFKMLTDNQDNLVTNGNFATDSDWTKAPSGVTISNGSVNFNSSSDTYVYQDILTTNKTYKITFSGTINSGSIYIGENGNAINIFTSGTYINKVAYFTVSSSQRFIIRKTGLGTLDASIDSVSVQLARVEAEPYGAELITNGDFATDSDWTKLNATISDGKGNLDGDGQTSLLYQNILTQNKSYKVTFTVSNYNGLGEARLMNNNGFAIYDITENGTFTIQFQHTNSSGNFIFRARTGAIYSIDNVSVKELQGHIEAKKCLADWIHKIGLEEIKQ